jgi:hypothetical protein
MKNADQSSRLPTASALLAALAFLLSLNVTEASSQSTPSEMRALNCVTPSGIEAVICADPDLPAQHRAMQALLAAAPVNAPYLRAQAQGLADDALMRFLQQYCSTDSVRSCLLFHYFHRLRNLAVDALFLEPETALEALRLLEPRYAPVYEAIYRYGTIDDEAQRTNAVAKLITPIFEALRVEPAIAPAFKDIPDAHAAAATDKAFSVFIIEAAGAISI